MTSARRIEWLVCSLLLFGGIPVVLTSASWVYGVLLVFAIPLGRIRPVGPSASRRIRLLLRLLLFAATAWFLYEWIVAETSGVVSIAHYMLLLAAIKLFEPRRTRDLVLLVCIALALLVIAAILSAELVFPLALLGFFLVGPYTGIQLLMARERDAARAAGQAGPAILLDAASGTHRPPPLRAASALIALLALAGGISFFVIVPRAAARAAPRWLAPAATRFTGFDRSADLNTDASIIENNEIVMRVWATHGESVLTLDVWRPYLRGLARERYVMSERGRRARRGPVYSWISPSLPAPQAVRVGIRANEWAPLLGAGFAVDESRHIRLDVSLESTRSNTLFLPYPAVAVSATDVEELLRDPRDQSLIARWPRRGGGASYSALVAPNMTPDLIAFLAAERGALNELRAPEPENIPVSQRVRDIALEIWDNVGRPPLEDADGRIVTLRAIVEYLRAPPFVYSLERVERPEGSEPVEHFLTESRTGHCEVYATAMAVLAQTLGIPARFASGYVPQDFNPVAECYVVRQLDAHAWVEAWIPGRDWMVFDPTPVAGEIVVQTGLWRTLADYLDYFRYQWINVVVSFDSSQRSGLLEKLRRGWSEPPHAPSALVSRVAWFVRRLFTGPPNLNRGERALYWLLLVQVLIILAWIVRRAAGRVAKILAGRAARRRGPRTFYDRLEQLLAAAGHPRPPGLTPREHVSRIASARPDLAPAARLVDLFYATRYGRRALTAAESFEVSAVLRGLHAACRARVRHGPITNRVLDTMNLPKDRKGAE